ncbi:Uncharacterized protein QTN25_010090 [Entamoeba marina]
MDNNELIQRIILLELENNRLLLEKNKLINELDKLKSTTHLKSLLSHINHLEHENHILRGKKQHHSAILSYQDDTNVMPFTSSHELFVFEQKNANATSEEILIIEDYEQPDYVEDTKRTSFNHSESQKINTCQTTKKEKEGKFLSKLSYNNHQSCKVESPVVYKTSNESYLSNALKNITNNNNANKCSTEKCCKRIEVRRSYGEKLEIFDGNTFVEGIINSLKMANMRYETIDLKSNDIINIIENEGIGMDKWAMRIQLEFANRIYY